MKVIDTTTSKPIKKTLLNIEALKRAHQVISAVDNGPRRHIIKLLDEKKELTVMDIVITFRNPKWDQPVISQHLSKLRKNNLVNVRKEGKFRYYSINYEMMEKIAAFVSNIIKYKPVKKA